MYIKHILMAFTRDTKIEVWDGDRQYTQFKTVGDFMDNGLMTYTVVDKNNLFYIDTYSGKIIINLGEV